ncbi:MAG: neutral zinc metallopeptidase [Thermomicrobiales bacterium]
MTTIFESRLFARWLHIICASLLFAAVFASSLMTRNASANAATMKRELTTSASSIDSYWEGEFGDLGFTYSTPGLQFESGEFKSDCEGESQFAAYCGLDETIYLDPAAIDDVAAEYGNILPSVLLAHEWGHHLTFLFASYGGNDVDLDWLDKDWEIEVLADCLSGVYIGNLWYTFQTEEGDLTSAIDFMSLIGDPTHGSGDDRIVAFMHGFVDGLNGCDVLS